MQGHFPPSSSATGVRCFDAAAITTRATRGHPDIFRCQLISYLLLACEISKGCW
jgi:hypothetical protein